MRQLQSLFLALILATPLAQADSIYRYRVPLQMGQSGSQNSAGQLSVSPSQLSFADLAVGSSSSSAVVLQNTGAQPLALSALNYSGPGAFIVDTSACPASLNAQQSCAVGVTFAPPTRGLLSGQISISFAGGSSLVSLAGRGLQGELQASASTLTFDPVVAPGSSTQTLVVQNTGDANVGSISVSTQAPFSIGNACPGLAAGASCELSLSFAPSAAGSYSGTFELTSPVGALSVGLTGVSDAQTQIASLSQSLIDFGSVPQGSAALVRSVTVTNTGNSPLSIAGVSGLPSGVSLSSNSCSSIAPSASCSLSFTLATTALTEFSAASAALSGPTSPAAVALSGKVAGTAALVTSGSPVAFGSVIQNAAVADRTVALRNAGNEAMTLTGLSSLPSGISVVSNTCSAVAPNALCDLTLRLSSANVTSINTSVATLGATSNASIPVSAQVVAATQVATIVSGSPAAFGSVTQNAAAVSRTVVLRNTGNSPMTVSGLSGLPAAVTLSANTCLNTAPNATCDLTLRMATTAVTSFNATAATSGVSSAASIALSGTVTAAIAPVSASVSAQYYGNKPPPNNLALLVRVTNTSGAALSIVGANLCIYPQYNYTANNHYRALYNQSQSVTRVTSNSCTMQTFAPVSWPAGTFTLVEWGFNDEYSEDVASATRLCANGACYIDLRLSDGRTVRVNDSLQVSTY